VRASHRGAEDWDSSHVDVPVGATAVEALHLGAAADCSSACEMDRMSDHLRVRIHSHAEAAVPSSCISCAGQEVEPRGSQESHPMWKILANVEATGGPNHGKILENHAALPPCELCGPRMAGRQRLVEVFAGSRLNVATLIATDISRRVGNSAAAAAAGSGMLSGCTYGGPRRGGRKERRPRPTPRGQGRERCGTLLRTVCSRISGTSKFNPDSLATGRHVWYKN